MNQRQANRLATLRHHIRGKKIKQHVFDSGKYLYGYFKECYPKFDGTFEQFFAFIGISEQEYNHLFIAIDNVSDAQRYIKKILKESGWIV